MSDEKPFDVMIFTSASGWFLSLLRNLLLPEKTKLVSWHHGYEELMWQQMLLEEQAGGMSFSPQFKFYYGGMILSALRETLKRQDAIFFTSTEECDWVKQQYPKLADRVFYHPNGVSPSYWCPQRFEKPSAEQPKLLSVGYWDPWRKGRRYIVAMFEDLHQFYPDLTLTMAGTVVDEQTILSEFSESARKKVTVISKANELELIGLYHSHDIFVLPSLFEGMPLVMLEAMAAGLACVTTNNNGMKDLITHGETGLLVERRDVPGLIAAVRSVIDNPSLRHQLGEAAYLRMKNDYTWQQIGLRYEKTLLTLTGELRD